MAGERRKYDPKIVWRDSKNVLKTFEIPNMLPGAIFGEDYHGGVITKWDIRRPRTGKEHKIPLYDGKILTGVSRDPMEIRVSGVIVGIPSDAEALEMYIPDRLLDILALFRTALEGDQHKLAVQTYRNKFWLYRYTKGPEPGDAHQEYYRGCWCQGGLSIPRNQRFLHQVEWSFSCVAHDPRMHRDVGEYPNWENY